MFFSPLPEKSASFVLNDWRTVYVGVRKHWITLEEVLSYCEYGYIECTEEMFTGLYLLPTFSEEEFVKLLRKIYPNSIWDDIDKEIIKPGQTKAEPRIFRRNRRVVRFAAACRRCR